MIFEFMNISWKILLGSLAALVAPASFLCAENAVTLLPSTRIELKKFPDVKAPEAVYKHVEKAYRFDVNGACEFRCKSELRVNTLFAMNELCGETFIVYNPKFQRVKINAAYTIAADGVTRVDVPENAFNTVLPSFAADAPAFNFLRELVITHTALEPGATIVLDYSVFSAETGGLLFDEYADMPFPCEHLVLNFNGSVTEYFNVAARSREQYFVAKKTIPVIYPGMPAPAVRDFCTTENVALGDEGTQLLKRLIRDTMSESEKRAALVQFVREQVATIAIPSDLLLEAHLRDPDTVISSAYGTRLEKARLLWALLSKTFGDVFKIVRTADDDSYAIECESGEKIAVTPGKAVWEDISLNLACEFSDGKERIRGTATVAPLLIVPEAKLLAGDLLGAGMKPIKAEWLPEQRLLVQSERAAEATDGILIWQVPVAKRGIAAFDFETLPQERKSTLKIPVSGEAVSETYAYTIHLPEGWNLAGKAPADETENALGKVCFSVKQDGRKLEVAKTLELKTATIAPEAYPEFRALMTSWFEAANNRLIIRVAGKAPEAEKAE